MPANGPTGAEALSRIRNFAQLFQYLIDVLGWPLETDDLEDEDLADITYDWDPEELGIPRDRLSDLRRLQQMRPLTADQPWGVFFLEFAGSRLPITQVRRLLGSLVKKKRVTGDARRRAWSLDDLLFIVITGTDDSMQLHLLAFRGDDPRNAGFLPLAWRPAQSPTRHLRRLAEELLPRLSWPDDDHDIKSWRNAWKGTVRASRWPADQRRGSPRREDGQDRPGSQGSDHGSARKRAGRGAVLHSDGGNPSPARQ